eukprot:CAMPEP_0197657754 /NCGR_PEP_ID=MMETSP1338-20131121/44826_1 /TAXON_ID=43686 ORGANISM="Pelagodinium beii, Strain RCC1491" /NCGR_SAMPLE_ID=MMETSP1338 /ASSEMBLY_ACC=CAM_ASM_000754 /LENGTH=180 /DNA_ID=CAMNT_0043234201 /DNA_START=16 /DNA_END=558 /DNA_ORIENTATION=+
MEATILSRRAPQPPNQALTPAKRVLGLLAEDAVQRVTPAAELLVERASERGAHAVAEKVLEKAITLEVHVASKALLVCVQWMHLVLPLLGAVLLAEVAMHDLKRCKEEASSLFFFSAGLNGIDVALHIALAVIRWTEQLASWGHWVHDLEKFSFYLAFLSAIIAMIGAMVSKDSHKSKHD